MAMKKATKAALYSGLIFPGVGLLWLKHYKRAAIFIIPATVAFWYVCSTLYNAIEPVYSKMLRDKEEGIVVIDPTNVITISLKLAQDILQNLAPHLEQLALAKMILLAAWICSIISSYFVGKKIDDTNTTNTTNS